MRIKLTLRHFDPRLPFNHVNELSSAIHRWIGNNSLHGMEYSCLNFGMLTDLTKQGESLRFKSETPEWWIGCWNEDMVSRLISGIHKDSHLAFGVHVESVKVSKLPDLRNQMKWFAESPIIVRKKRGLGKPVEYIMFDHSEASNLLRQSLLKRLSANAIEVNEDSVYVSFDRHYRGSKSKLIYVNNIGVRGSICPVKVDAPLIVQEFLWTSGIGANTGMGFGALKI